MVGRGIVAALIVALGLPAAAAATPSDAGLIAYDDGFDPARASANARRLVEQGVRFVQICHAGGGNGGRNDAKCSAICLR